MSERRLDAEVAEKVFGWKKGRDYGNGNGEWIQPKGTTWHRKDYEGTPSYTRDIEHAFTILRFYATVSLLYDDATDCWHVGLDYGRCVGADCKFKATEEADGPEDTAALALAICKAAIKSKP